MSRFIRVVGFLLAACSPATGLAQSIPSGLDDFGRTVVRTEPRVPGLAIQAEGAPSWSFLLAATYVDVVGARVTSGSLRATHGRHQLSAQLQNLNPDDVGGSKRASKLEYSYQLVDRDRWSVDFTAAAGAVEDTSETIEGAIGTSYALVAPTDTSWRTVTAVASLGWGQRDFDQDGRDTVDDLRPSVGVQFAIAPKVLAAVERGFSNDVDGDGVWSATFIVNRRFVVGYEEGDTFFVSVRFPL